MSEQPTMELNEQAPTLTLARKLGDTAHVSGLAIQLARLSGAGRSSAGMAAEDRGGTRRQTLPARLRSIAPA